jgi:dGTPase
VVDLIEESERRLRERGIRSINDVRAQSEPAVGFSPELRELKGGLEIFLRTRVYRHHRVVRMAATGQRLLRSLFDELVRNPELLPDKHLSRWEGASVKSLRPRRSVVPVPKATESSIERVVADYLAGMTDRFARQEYLRLFHPGGDS